MCVCVVEGRRLPGLGNTMENRQASPFADLAWGSAGDADKFARIIKCSGIHIAIRGGKRRMEGPA